MIKIKDRIPNIDALNLELDLALENNLTAFVKATSETRQSLVSTRWLVGISVLFLMLSSSALFLLIQAAMVVMLFFIIAFFSRLGFPVLFNLSQLRGPLFNIDGYAFALLF